VDLIGFVEAVCTLLIVIVCPARIRMTPTRLRQAKPWRLQSRDPAKLSRILASW
jgi:hypothetical protein